MRGFLALRARLLIALVFAGVDDALVDRFPSGEAFFETMPVGDALLAELPTEQDDVVTDLAREVEQADIEIFYLYADRVDLGYGILGALDGFLALRLEAGVFLDVEQQTAREQDALVDEVELL